jgi:hypothetical protein
LLYSNYALKSRQFFDFFQPFLLLLTEQEGASKTPLRKHGVVFCSKKKKKHSRRKCPKPEERKRRLVLGGQLGR